MQLSARDASGATPLHLAASPAAARLLLTAQRLASAAAAPAACSPRQSAGLAAPGSARRMRCSTAVAEDQPEMAPITAAAAAVARHAGKRQKLEAAWLATLAPPTPPSYDARRRQAVAAQAQQPAFPPAAAAAAPQAARPSPAATPRLPDPPLRRAVPGKAVPCTPGCPAPIRPAAGSAALQTVRMCGTAAAMQSLSLLTDIPGSPYRFGSAQAA